MPGGAAHSGQGGRGGAFVEWYLDASTVALEDLDACAVVARSLPDGTVPANLIACQVLGSLTHASDLWMFENPCPDADHGQHLVSVVGAFVDLRLLVEQLGGRSAALGDGVLALEIDAACELITKKVRMIVAGLLAADGR